MNPEDKELLLKDLCARLRSGVIVKVQYKDGEGWKVEDRKLLGIYEDGQVYVDCVYTNIENVKPYLRPMSSMTEEEREEFRKVGGVMSYNPQKDTWAISAFTPEAYDWLNKNKFDYRGLIPMGLAIEAPEDMYK